VYKYVKNNYISAPVANDFSLVLFKYLKQGLIVLNIYSSSILSGTLKKGGSL
jgi:hypothetical protein